MKLDEAEITSKSVEISKCLTNFSSQNLLLYIMNNVTTTGDAARLAVCLRNKEDFITEQNLAGICTGIKIDFRLATSKLIPLFQQFGWVQIKYEGKKIGKITETLPPTEDILTTLGKNFLENEPNEVEEGSLNALSALSNRPHTLDSIQSELSLQDNSFETMLDYGQQAKYFGIFTSKENQKQIVWTPLYWSKNSEKVENYLSKQSETNLQKIGELSMKFKQYPGLPIDSLIQNDLSIVNAGISQGFFPSIRIINKKYEPYDYVFAATPQFDVNKNSDIFEKARMIISCIRHGQYHAEITKIKYPLSILRSLRNDIMGSHSYANVQYAILALNGIVRFERSSSGLTKVRWIDTPENNLAADVAELLLRQEEVIDTTQEELETKKILVQGVFNYSSEQRRLVTVNNITAKDEFNKLIESISGARF